MQLGELRNELNKFGRPGFSTHRIYVKGDLNDLGFIQQLFDYYEIISYKSRATLSAIDAFWSIIEEDYPSLILGRSVTEVIQKIARQNLKDDGQVVNDASLKEATRIFIADIWNDIRDNTDKKLLRSWLSKNGLIITANDTSTTSLGMASFRDKLLYAASGFNKLTVSTPSKIAQYPDVDAIVANGSVVNPFLSQVMIAVICFIWVSWNNKKGAGKYKLCPYKTGLFMAIPFVLATATMYAFMIVAGLSLDIASSAISNIAISVAIDLPVFLIAVFQLIVLNGSNLNEVLQDESLIEEVGKAMVDITANTLAFFVLILSIFPVVYRVGWLMVLTLVACAIGTLLVMLPMMRWAVVKR